MWTRVELKEKAKIALKQNYWKIVLVCMILGLIGVDGDPSFELNYKTEESIFHSTDMLSIDEYNALYGGGSAFVNPSIILKMLGFSVAPAMMSLIVAAAIVAMVFGIVLAVLVFNPIDLGARRFLVKSLNENADMHELLYGFHNNYKNVVKVMFFRDMSILLWSLLLVVPGIIKAYEYFMVPYLLGENPNLSTDEALQMSKEMMDGHKWNTFVLQLSFIGWDLLAAFTIGIVNAFYVAPYRNLTLAALFEKLNALSGYPARRVNSYRYENTRRPYNESDMI